jgi:hypothetical protein
VQDPARDVQPLAHAARAPLDALALAARQADEVEQLRDAAPLVARRDAVELGEVAKVVVAGEAVLEATVAAEDVADPPPHLARLPHDVETEHARAAAGRGSGA